VAVLSQDKTDVSRRVEANDRGKKMAYGYLEKNDLESGSKILPLMEQILRRQAIQIQAGRQADIQGDRPDTVTGTAPGRYTTHTQDIKYTTGRAAT